MNNKAILSSTQRSRKTGYLENGAMGLLAVLATIQIVCAFNASLDMTKADARSTALVQHQDGTLLAKR